jgi:hypothetical protein
MVQTLLPNATKSPLEEGDYAVEFTALTQKCRKTTLSELLATGPILLFTSWSRDSNLRGQYFEAFKKYENSLKSKGHQIVFMGSETFAQCKEDQQQYGLENCIFIDDITLNRFLIHNTYLGNNPSKVRNTCFCIDTDMQIRFKQHYPEAYNLELFFELVSDYLTEVY